MGGVRSVQRVCKWVANGRERGEGLRMVCKWCANGGEKGWEG